MPKGGDSLCPLGFHPQFRRPNYCKRCFREYGEHKAARELSGSTTSLNSVSSYDPNTNSYSRRQTDDKENTSLYGSRDSLISSSRPKEEVDSNSTTKRSSSLTRTKSEDDDSEKKSSLWGSKSNSWTKSRPMSWSAQDLRQAVDDAKQQMRVSREDVSMVYGSTRSLSQDMGSIGDLRESSSDLSKAKDESTKNSSFSSYLAMRTKSPGRPPYSRTSSLPSHSTGGSSTPNNIDERESTVKPLHTSLSTTPSSSSTRSTKSILKEEPEERKAKRLESVSKLNSIKSSNLSSITDEKPPRPPYRIKDKPFSGTRLPDLNEEKPRRIIQGLKGDASSDNEIKTENADASYVVHLSKPKKDSSTTKKVEIDLQPELDRVQKENKELDKQLDAMNEKIDQLERENKELQTKRPRFGDLKKQTDVTKLQQKIDDLQDESKSKSKKVKELEKEIDKRPLPKDVEKTIEDLRSKLQAAEQLCEELMDETEDYKKDIHQLEEEVEELQDNFREEQADEYRDLKRELEQRAKDCRVLQFKHKKSERRVDVLERDKQDVEEKLRELQLGEDDINRAERVKMLEKEVNLAKEVSKKMHDEMEKMKKQLEAAETDKKKLKENLMDRPTSRLGQRSAMLGRQNSQDNTEQLIRDLQATQEREQDIKEQLKFSEEETKSMRKKMSRMEEENETLQLQLNKMSSKAKANRQRSGSLERAGSVEKGSLSRQGSTEKPPPPTENDIDPTELKIQLELNEQESAVLRRKVEDLESENERLQKEIKELFTKNNKKADLGPAPETTKDNLYFDKKIKMLERENTDLRQKSINLDKERDQLKSELELAKKRAKVTRNRSLEMTDTEIRKCLESTEIECEHLKNKLEEHSAEMEKLLDENRRLDLKSVRRLPLTNAEITYIEKNVLEDKLKRLEKRFKEATEKLKNVKPSSNSIDSTVNSEKDSKINQLQIRIDELQQECDQLTKEANEIKNMSVTTDRTPKKPKDTTPKATLYKWVAELDDECARLHMALRDSEKKRGGSRPGSEDLTNLRDLEDKLERERERNDELTRQLHEERQKPANKSGPSNRPEEIKKYQTQIDDLKNKLEASKVKLEDLKSKQNNQVDFEELRRAQTEKHRLQKELEEERNNVMVSEDRHKELTMSWLKERDEMKKELNELKRTRDQSEKNLKTLQKTHGSMESRLNDETRKKEDAIESKKKDNDQVKSLRSDKELLEIQLDELRDTVKTMERSNDKSTAKHKKDVEQILKEREDLKIRMNTLESELKSEKKKRERLESEAETTPKNKYGSWNKNIGKGADDIEKVKREFKSKVDELEKHLKKEKQETEDLQNKYDLLEEEFVVAKAQFTMGKDNREYESLKREYDTIESELKNLRETYNLRQDTWIKEKLSMQEQLKALDERLNKATAGSSSYTERKQLRDIIEDKNQQIDQMKRDEESVRDQVTYYRRESEDMRRKVDDLEKLQELNERRQGTSSNDNSTYEATIRDLRSRLTGLEKTHKADNTKMKMKNDTKQKALTEEVSTLASHMSKYRRERDTYKEMLDGAQKTIADLKGATAATYRTSRADNATEAQAHLSQVQELHSSITELEDKLADSRLEGARLKNMNDEQKTNSEISMSDLQTKINEYEEDRLLGGGSRRVPGLRTRLELNWQKEREEQLRLIQETATLAKDLRNTLYEVERERDMERLEAKRKIDQLRRAVDQEHQDTKNKVHELQRDLLELREAHAKLRQINEKLRREKDRTEVEREAMRDKFLGSSRDNLNQQSKIERLVDEMKKVKDLAPLVIGEGIDGKDGSLNSLTGEIKPKTKEEFTDSLKKMSRISEELKIMLNLTDDHDRLRRAHSFRRALSVESDDDGPPTRSRSATRGLHKGPMPRGQKGQLYRKAQSLDHQMAEERGKIWVSTDAGSTSSIESTMTDDARKAKYDWDSSLDRISTGSQTSETEGGTLDKKKTSGFKSMFSKLGKTKSIEESSTGGSILDAGKKAMVPGVGGSGSDGSLDAEKDTVKDKLKTFFKKNQSSTSSRTRSIERDGLSSTRKVASRYEGDTSSIASNTSLDSTASASVPAVMRRFRGRQFGSMVKAQSFSALGRQGSFETQV